MVGGGCDRNLQLRQGGWRSTFGIPHRRSLLAGLEQQAKKEPPEPEQADPGASPGAVDTTMPLALAPRCVGARPGHIQAPLQQPEIPRARRAGVGSLAGRARVRRRRPTRRWRRRSGATPVTTEPSRARRGPVERARQASAGREPGRECDMVVQRGLGASPAAPGCWPPTSTCSSRGDRATVFEHTAGRHWQAGKTEAHIRG